MQRTVSAIFDSGIFRPLEPVDLAEGTRVEIAVPTVRPNDNAAAENELSHEQLSHQQATIDDVLIAIENLPIEEADDGFSGRDHDKVLYGSP